MKLSARLAAIADYVRPGVVLCDIGTDHAHIPVALALNGTIAHAVASDINAGPVARARSNVKANNVDGIVDVVLTDGLRGLEPYAPDDIIIAGMGGELIRDIIDISPLPRSHGVRLILQPMTMQAALREYLDCAGFHIIGEKLVEDGKIYNVICADYEPDNHETPYSQLECIVGRRLIESPPPLFKRYISGILNVYRIKAEGMEQAGLGTVQLRELILQLESLIK